MEQSKAIFRRPPLRLRVTHEQKCPYLPNQTEQRLAADISCYPQAHDPMAEAGFRRLENWIFKPVCPNCNACQSFRVKVEGFKPSCNMLRIKNANKDLICVQSTRRLTLEHYDMFQKYLNDRHENGPMLGMSFDEFSAMVLNSPIPTWMNEYQDSQGNLMGCILVDGQRDGLSAVFSFFHPEQRKRSLGNLMILDLIEQCKAINLPYAYLGYYIKQSAKMTYKTRFKPYQIFTDGVWQDQ